MPRARRYRHEVHPDDRRSSTTTSFAHGHNADPVLAELAKETEALGPIAMMQIAPEQGTLMSILVRAIGARSAVEIGTFTGYSSICIARGLPPRRPPAVLRRQRGVDDDRAQVLGEGGRRRPHRAAHRAGGRDAARAARRLPRRLRLHRRRQGVVPRLLRGAAAAPAAERADRVRQRAVDGPGARSAIRARTTRGRCRR